MNNSSVTPGWINGRCDFSNVESRFDAFLLVTIAAISLCGNITVFVCYVRYYMLRSATNVFLLSLSASDILVALISIPFTFGIFLCKLDDGSEALIYKICDILPSVLSIYSLTLIAVDRALAVTNPFCHQYYVSQKLGAVTVIAMWFSVSFAVALISVLERNHFTLFIIVVSYAIPVHIMAISYLLIGYVTIKHAWAANLWDKSSLRIHGNFHNGTTENGERSPSTSEIILLSDQSEKRSWHSHHRGKVIWKEFKSAINLLSLLVVFVAAWTPFMSLNIEHYRCPSCYIDSRLIIYFKMLHYSNSALNPILYVLLNKRWKAAFRMALHITKRNESAPEDTLIELAEW